MSRHLFHIVDGKIQPAPGIEFAEVVQSFLKALDDQQRVLHHIHGALQIAVAQLRSIRGCAFPIDYVDKVADNPVPPPGVSVENMGPIVVPNPFGGSKN